MKMWLSRNRNTPLAVVVVLALLAWQYYNPETDAGRAVNPAEGAGNDVQAAYQAGRSGVWMETRGRISRILPDDNDGSRHQRFILDVGNHLTVMVAHNIDLADRVPAVVGDSLELRGRYEWNERGGVIHWTHHDPQGREQGGWLYRDGRRYE